MGLEGKRRTGEAAGKVRWVLGVEGTLGYMIREELQREKLRNRAGKRAWRFEKRLEEGRESEIVRKCWEELRGRCKRKKEISKWEEERCRFFEDKGNMGEVKTRKDEGRLDFAWFNKKDVELDRKERRERIERSSYKLRVY